MVQKHQDIDDFEGFTNKEFNKSYENALLNSNQTVRPLIKSRATRRREAQESSFKVNEQNINSFTFKSMFHKNQYQGRMTSTIDADFIENSFGPPTMTVA